ncbi:hypothetical protein [Pseudoruegeria sp. SK021]|uniref:hypothetical protein n=1 Tax=Pseudoruegeria sp. SK021 TaxID=1933035 RepID=UPI00111C3302|nr:hypothetical protein [Pseudoruegeria sp. SK021]
MTTFRAIVLPLLSVGWVAIAGAAQAVTTLSLAAAPNGGIQQSAQGPCVIGDPSCVSNVLLPEGFTTLPSGGPGSYSNIMSPNYLVSNLRGVLQSDLFNIQIDVNEARGQGAQSLSLFSMSLVGGGLLAEYVAPAGTPIPAVNNPGNGYSDYFLSGFSLAGLAATDRVKFAMSMPIKNGGREQFFLQSVAVPAVPVPAAGLLLLTAAGAMAGLRRRLR